MKFIELVSTFVLVACFVGDCTCISGGTSVTSLTGYAYQASVLGPLYVCSGAIVSSQFILTSAYCVFGVLPALIDVRVGSTQVLNGGITPVVKNLRTHPNYNPLTLDYNVAVLRLATPLSIRGISAISLATSVPPQNALVVVTGFGAVNAPALNVPDHLQAVTLTVLPVSTAQKLWGSRLITARMFCAGDQNGKKDCCQGDEGSPLVYNNELYGIYSFGGKCGNAKPSAPVFTSIPALRNWIQQLIVN